MYTLELTDNKSEIIPIQRTRSAHQGIPFLSGGLSLAFHRQSLAHRV